MGWDAFSSAKVNWAKHVITNPEIDNAFKEAAKYVEDKTGTVDGFLRLGGLDVSDCGKMIEMATGRSVWSSDVCPADKIFCNWDFGYTNDDAWAYWSARKFMEVCAKYRLEIRFSW